MPTASISIEASAIEAAYGARVQTLYIGLATNLGDSPASEQQGVDSFTKGLNIAKRARQLALNVIGAGVSASTAQSRSKKVARK
jgi:hypothetical protein